ncbi:cystatin 10-like [Castor canadensis]
MVYIVQFLLLTVAIALAMSPVVSSESMTGAIQEADINDKDVQQVVDFVLKFYNDENDDLYASRAVQVMSAKRQVMAGTLYYLKLELGRTTCTKSQFNLSACPLNEEPDQQKREICNFQVYNVPWEHEISVENYRCHSV